MLIEIKQSEIYKAEMLAELIAECRLGMISPGDQNYSLWIEILVAIDAAVKQSNDFEMMRKEAHKLNG